jgi:hypothetical protein
MCEKPENSKLDQFADYLVDNYIDSYNFVKCISYKFSSIVNL